MRSDLPKLSRDILARSVPPIMLPMAESDPRFSLRSSTIPGAGTGLFSNTALQPGDRLEVVGILIEKDSLADRCTAYADTHKFQMGNQLLIPLGFGGMVNHSATPNMIKVAEGTVLYLEAIRTIPKGEELFFCYSDYARKRFNLDNNIKNMMGFSFYSNDIQ